MNLSKGVIQNSAGFNHHEWQLYLELKEKAQQHTGLSLREAVDRFVDKWQPDVTDKTIEDAFEIYKKTLSETVGKRHLDDVKQRIKALKNKFPERMMSSLTRKFHQKKLESGWRVA